MVSPIIVSVFVCLTKWPIELLIHYWLRVHPCSYEQLCSDGVWALQYEARIFLKYRMTQVELQDSGFSLCFHLTTDRMRTEDWRFFFSVLSILWAQVRHQCILAGEVSKHLFSDFSCVSKLSGVHLKGASVHHVHILYSKDCYSGQVLWTWLMGSRDENHYIGYFR